MKVSVSIIASILLIAIAQLAIAKDDPTIATVNGVDLKQSMLEFYTQQSKQLDPKSTTPTVKLTNDLVNLYLLKQEALKKKLNSQGDFQERLNFIKLNLLSQAAMIDFLDNNPIPEKRIKEEYDARIKQVKMQEFKASHILLKDEAKAKEVIAKLSNGKKFADMAKEYSTGPTASNGGDLGWFNPQRMVPEFSQAVVDLKDNEYTKQAVRTQFGYHVIIRTGVRDAKPPAFEEVKPNITAGLEQQHLQKHINELRKAAKISIPKK